MKMLDKNYNFTQIEQINHKKWKDLKINQYNPNISREETFVVDTPPPGISGTLHMGHVFSYTQTDFIVRYKRMIGKNIFYPMGFVFWTLIYDSIYAFLDIEDDKKIGVKSLAIILENKNSKLYFYFFGTIFLFLSILSEILIKPGYYIYMNIIPAFIIYYLINSLEIKNKISVMKIFKNNIILGSSLLVVILCNFIKIIN